MTLFATVCAEAVIITFVGIGIAWFVVLSLAWTTVPFTTGWTLCFLLLGSRACKQSLLISSRSVLSLIIPKVRVQDFVNGVQFILKVLQVEVGICGGSNAL